MGVYMWRHKWVKVALLEHTMSLKISLWWTWMVMRVSNFTRSTFFRSWVVTAMREFNISRKYALVWAMIFLSLRALLRATSESRVQIIWMPSRPTWYRGTHKEWMTVYRNNTYMYVGTQSVLYKSYTCTSISADANTCMYMYVGLLGCMSLEITVAKS